VGWSYTILFIGPVRYIRIYVIYVSGDNQSVASLLLGVHGPYTVVYTAVPCIQGRIDGLLRTQPCTRPVKHGRVYGPYTAVYTIVYTTVQMDEYTAVYGRCIGRETSGHAVTV